MNKIFLFIALAFISCGSETKQETRLPGDFKYVAYRWNDSRDSVGISLLHYLGVNEKGDYSLALRDSLGNAKYYYGFLDNATLAAMIGFVADSSLSGRYTGNEAAVTSNSGPTYRFDYATKAGERKIIFKQSDAPDAVRHIQAKLDSIIKAPGKKESAAFNINDYLKRVITDSAGN